MNNLPFQTFSTLTTKEKRIASVANLPSGRRLELVTHKDFSGLLVTRATVGILDGDFFLFIMGRDYCHIMERSNQRLTKKAYEEQHARYVEQLDTIAETAEKFYQGVDIQKSH